MVHRERREEWVRGHTHKLPKRAARPCSHSSGDRRPTKSHVSRHAFPFQARPAKLVYPEDRETGEERAQRRGAVRSHSELLEQRDRRTAHVPGQFPHVANRSVGSLPHRMNEGLLESGRQRRALERFRQVPQTPCRARDVEAGPETRSVFGEPDHRRHTHAKQLPGQLGIGIRHENHRHLRPLALEPGQQVNLRRPNPARASDHDRLDLTVETGERFGGIRHAGAGARGSAYFPSCLRRVGDYQDHGDPLLNGNAAAPRIRCASGLYSLDVDATSERNLSPADRAAGAGSSAIISAAIL